MKNEYFRFKDLKVWQKALDYADKIIQVTENLNTEKHHYRLIEQLESSSASVAQNISEGKGRYSKKEFVQFLYFSRGSFNETLTLINLFHKRNWISEKSLDDLEEQAYEIACMLKALINSISRSI